MSDIFKADVVVVGGGPAGSAAAILCAQNDLDTIIIEREKFPREHPGETVHPGIEPLLKQLGVFDKVLSAGFIRHSGNWVNWGNKKQFISFGKDNSEQWKGYQLWRSEFDSILLNRALELGVKILQPCHVFKPLLNENKNTIVGVSTSNGKIYSSFVVDASGSQHWLTKQLNKKINKFSPLLVATYGYAKEEKFPPFYYDNNPSLTADKYGWTWIAKVRSSLYQWIRLNFSIDYLDKKFYPKELQGMKKEGFTHSADVTWRIVSEPSGPGYFIVGDSAYLLDPSSSHGILKAIMSGIMSGYLINKININKELKDIARMEYHKWITNWFIHDLTKLKEFYIDLPHPPKWII
jgi:flavin-dependent dehydrogenase